MPTGPVRSRPGVRGVGRRERTWTEPLGTTCSLGRRLLCAPSGPVAQPIATDGPIFGSPGLIARRAEGALLAPVSC